MRLNPFRSRWVRQSRRNSADWGNAVESKKSSVSLFFLACGVGLFVLAVAFTFWPVNGDRTVSSNSVGLEARVNGDRPTRVAADRQLAASNVTSVFPDLPDASDDGIQQQLMSRECQRRRSALAEESSVVDRFDLDAVGNLNVRIGLFNADCARVEANSQSGGKSATVSAPSVAQNESAPAELAEPSRLGARMAPGPSAPAGKPRNNAPRSGTGKPRTPAGEATTAEAPGKNGWSPTVLSVQSLLSKLGYQPGPADGLIGRRTRQAVMKFQADQGLAVNGDVTLELLEAVLAVYPGGASARKSSAPGDVNSTGEQSNPVRIKEPAATNGDPASRRA